MISLDGAYVHLHPGKLDMHLGKIPVQVLLTRDVNFAKAVAD